MILTSDHIKFMDALKSFRQALVFSKDTAYSPDEWKGGSDGHCAVVALLARHRFGGDLVSAEINNQSHWHNLFWWNEGFPVCVDLTGDQFGRDAIQVRFANPAWIYERTRARDVSEVDAKTKSRAAKLNSRSGVL